MNIIWNNIRNNVTIWVTAVIGAISVTVLVMGQTYDSPAASVNGALAVLSLFYVALVIRLIAKEPVLLVGALPGIAVVFAIWLPVAFAEAEQPELVILLPLPLIAAFLVLWTPVAWGMFRLTRRWKKKLALGAAAETVAMCLLLLPWLLAAVVFPGYLDQNNVIVAAFASIGIGLLWSKLISDPFARLVKAFAYGSQDDQKKDPSE